MMHIVFVALAVLIAIPIGYLAYLLAVQVRNKYLDYTVREAQVQVVRKSQEASYESTTVQMIGDTMRPMPEQHDEENDIYVSYEGTERCFQNKDVYDAVEVGDYVTIEVHEGRNQKGEIKNVYLSLTSRE
jgi:tRNA A37 methylthiotransferase MiaB